MCPCCEFSDLFSSACVVQLALVGYLCKLCTLLLSDCVLQLCIEEAFHQTWLPAHVVILTVTKLVLAMVVITKYVLGMTTL